MSTQVNQYLIYGVKAKYDDYINDDTYPLFEKYMDNSFSDHEANEDAITILDGENEDCIYVGVCMMRSSNHETIGSFKLPKTVSGTVVMKTIKLLNELNISGPREFYFVTHIA